MGRFRIAQLAQERGLSVSELHRRIIENAPPDRPEIREITYSTVLRLWNGKTTSPIYDTLEGIAIALGVEVRDLFTPKEKTETDDAHKNIVPHYADA